MTGQLLGWSEEGHGALSCGESSTCEAFSFTYGLSKVFCRLAIYAWAGKCILLTEYPNSLKYVFVPNLLPSPHQSCPITE